MLYQLGALLKKENVVCNRFQNCAKKVPHEMLVTRIHEITDGRLRTSTASAEIEPLMHRKFVENKINRSAFGLERKQTSAKSS